MIKRIIPFISLWLFFACTSKNQKEISLIELVPQNASFVAQINDSISLKSSMELSKIFSLNSDLKKLFKISSPKFLSPWVIFLPLSEKTIM